MKNKEDNNITLPAIGMPMKPFIQTCLFFSIVLNPGLLFISHILFFIPYTSEKAFALPPTGDIPEEVLRTEIILEGRSPIDGKPLSAREYEELKAKLAQSSNDPKIDPDIKELIFLLQLRKLVKTIIPFY